jgi:hypothetical protein
MDDSNEIDMDNEDGYDDYLDVSIAVLIFRTVQTSVNPTEPMRVAVDFTMSYL